MEISKENWSGVEISREKQRKTLRNRDFRDEVEILAEKGSEVEISRAKCSSGVETSRQ